MSVKKRNSVRSIVSRQPNEQAIAERAYTRWLARGCPLSDGREDWFAAEAELERETPKRSSRPRKTQLNSATALS